MRPFKMTQAIAGSSPLGNIVCVRGQIHTALACIQIHSFLTVHRGKRNDSAVGFRFTRERISKPNSLALPQPNGNPNGDSDLHFHSGGVKQQWEKLATKWLAVSNRWHPR